MNYRLINIYLILLLLVVNLNLIAHGDEHKKEEKHDTVTVVEGDTIAVNGVPVIDSIKTGGSESVVKQTKEEEHEEEAISIGSELFEHMHNKLIHFPIVLIIAALILTLLGYKEEGYETVIKIFVGLAILFGVASIITGLNQAEPFMDSPKEWIVNIHKIMGIITIVLTGIWEILLFTKANKKYSLAFAVVTSIVVLAVGFLGGIIAH